MNYALMALCAVMFCACGLLSPEQQQTALQVVDSMYGQGAITQAQHDALVQALLSGSTTAWWQQLVQVIGSAALAYAGVQWRRGPVATPTERAARISPPSTPTP
jgi:hypothetical protein